MPSRGHFGDEQDRRETDRSAQAHTSAEAEQAPLNMESARASAVSHRSPPPLPVRSMMPQLEMNRRACIVDPSSDPRVSIAASASADDIALAPVEREAASAPPRRRGALSWSGWVIASALLVSGAAHYVLVYRPLEKERARAEATRVQRFQAHEEQVSSLRTQLERTRAELEQAKVETAALKASSAETAAASAIEAADTAPEPVKKDRARRSARRKRPPSDNAKVQGTSSRRQPQARAGKPTNSSMPLRGVLSSSNDPLEGL